MGYRICSAMFARAGRGAFVLALATLEWSVTGATITVDGVNVKSLSEAVQQAQDQDDGPHVINITANSLTADSEVLITEPMTINGDPDHNGKCDILVDIEAIRQGKSSVGQPEKCYIEIQAGGSVVINDLQIHPNADGSDLNDPQARRVDGIRMYRPLNAGEEGNYTLNRVWLSGSDEANNYVYMDTPNDLYAITPKKWGSGGKGKGHEKNGVIQMTNEGGAGIYNAELNDCHAGLGKSSAMNIQARGGLVQIDGGLYGHSGRDGIHIDGTGVSLTGSQKNRLRVLRVPNISGGNAHGVEVEDGSANLIEYVDVATINTGNQFKMSNCKVGTMQNCRGLGKLGNGINSAMFIEGNCEIGPIKNCSIVARGDKCSPVQTPLNFRGTVNFIDSIFTCDGTPSSITHSSNDAGSRMSFKNCALPTEGAGNTEKLKQPVISGSARLVSQENTISAAPQYMLTLRDYDWSEDQGSLDPRNGVGNANVLRPANPAYATAATGGAALTGGAGRK